MLNEMAQESYRTAVSKGWFDHSPSFAEQIALVHTELSEALQAYRKGEVLEIVGTELADTILRILTLCESYHIDIDAAIKAKMLYNTTRPYRHGNLRA